jgi:hypothetical protein
MVHPLRRRQYVRMTPRTVVLLFAAAIIAGCSRKLNTAPGTGSGTLAIQLTDAPFLSESAQSVDVFVVRVDVHLANIDSADAENGAPDDSAGADGWTTVATPNASINLLDYQYGIWTPLGNARVPAGSYKGFRLIIDPNRSSLTMRDGQRLTNKTVPSVTFPSAARSGIKVNFTRPVVVSVDDTTTVLIDFAVEESFVTRGNSVALGGLLFKPVLRGTVKP